MSGNGKKHDEIEAQFGLKASDTYCTNCAAFRSSKLTAAQKDANSARQFVYLDEPDIAWLRRSRECPSCGQDYETAEAPEHLLEELYQYRKFERAKRRKTSSAITRKIRSERQWLASTGAEIPYSLAEELVESSAWWLTHSSGMPVRAPRHADRLQKTWCGWAVEFGANSFAASRAMSQARQVATDTFQRFENGLPISKTEVLRRLRGIPSSCVLNINGDLYDDYPEDGGDLIFGAQAINIEDCALCFLRATGLNDLFASATEK